MSHSSANDWKPDPEMLAAYFDGELEGRDDANELRARIEAWIEANPHAAEHWTAQQQLKTLWADTTPAEPSADAWARTRKRIDAAHKRPRAAGMARRSWIALGAVAASVLVILGVLALTYQFRPKPPQPDDQNQFVAEPAGEMLEVALSSEVTILRIDTDDIEYVIVGEMPVSAPLEMVGSGEACITCKCPRVMVRQDPPMVWGVAKID